MCLSCGFDGDLLQGDFLPSNFTCPSCDADLYARPPRAYSEMEGLASTHARLTPIGAPPRRKKASPGRLLRTLSFAAAGLFAAAALALIAAL